MSKLRITKEFGFEMAHMLDGYNGRCSNLHGHSYRLFVTVEGELCANGAAHDNGRGMEEKKRRELEEAIKNVVNEEVIDKFDHSVTLWRESPQCEAIPKTTERINLVGYRPTSENLVCDIAERIAKRLPAGVRLYSIKLSETATSCVEWINDED